ncbi:MAG: hypothetical protein JXR36_08455 [Bacteroidales bacterium]|nr:hypothetical protein [Bacteroidales bacterium]
MKNILYVISFFLFVGFVLSSCNNDKPKQSDESPGIVDNRECVADSILADFYKFLSQEEYDKCISYFSSNLFENLDSTIIYQGLQNRNSVMNISSGFEILYQYNKTDVELGDLAFFHTKCFTEEGEYHFENIGFIRENGICKIQIYEYGNMPYVSLDKANDTASGLNSILTELYRVVNFGDFDDALALIDQELVDRVGIEKVKNGFENALGIKKGVQSFEVEEVYSEMLEDIPVVVMRIAETGQNGVTVTEITLSCRLDGYKIAMAEDIPVVLLDPDKELSGDELKAISSQIDKFYNFLKSGNYEIILNSIDKIVFSSVDRETIRNSFVQRNTYYGVPVDYNISTFSVQSINDKPSVEIILEVNNQNKKQSKEKIILIQSKSGQLKLYAYEYSESKF